MAKNDTAGSTPDQIGQGAKLTSPDPPSDSLTGPELAMQAKDAEQEEKDREAAVAEYQAAQKKGARPQVDVRVALPVPEIPDLELDEGEPGGHYIVGEKHVDAEGHEIKVKK